MNFGSVRVAFHPIVKTWSARGRILFSRKYLLYTNVGISVTLSTTGDFLNQRFQIKKKEIDSLDILRSRDVAITGLFIGPFCHYWYLFLDWWIPGRCYRLLAKKVIIDQLVCSPVVIGLFLGITTLLEKKSLTAVKEECFEKGGKLYVAELAVWPPAQLFNFYFLPTHYRVLFDNAISFLFDIYFSRVKYGKNGRVES